MKSIIVLGAGIVGKAMAIDLCFEYKVCSVDNNEKTLQYLSQNYPIETTCADLSDPGTIKDIVKNYDLVIGALPGFMGFQNLQAVIESRKNIVDISFFENDPFELDELAKKNNVTAIVDCGVAPGMSNMILGFHNSQMEVSSFECFVGGLPEVRFWPYEYKAPFSPVDVIEEYIRPARLVENSRVVIRPALSEPEFLEIEPVGTLEAFNTDGLRTLLKTMNIPNMKEKTLRYPGHIEYIKVLKETGFFAKEPVKINNTYIRPLDLTAKLLLPKWQLRPDDKEFTVMKITVRGKSKGKIKKYSYSLFDRYDDATKTPSMARTTGYTCTSVARLILEDRFFQKGIIPPEYIGANQDLFKAILGLLNKKNVHYECTEDN